MTQILSRSQKQIVGIVRSHSKKNSLHKFNRTIKNQECQMTFTTVRRHLIKLQFVGCCEDYRDECEPSDLIYCVVERVVLKVIFYYVCCYNINLCLMQYCLLCC